jgi:hypothetical protein
LLPKPDAYDILRKSQIKPSTKQFKHLKLLQNAETEC